MANAAIVMPKLGLTMSEGMVIEWLVAPGDHVVAGQALFVVETDKISNEIEAPAEGIIREILVQAGENVPVGATVATWTGQGKLMEEPQLSGDVQCALPAVKIPLPSPLAGDRPQDTVAEKRVRATPLARRMARIASRDIASIPGTGPRGRIQARDVQAELDSVRPVESSAMAPAARATDRRAMIAAQVSRSKAEIPHFYVAAEAGFDKLALLRQELNALQNAPRKLSVTAFLGMAVVRALSVIPEAEVLWREGGNRRPAVRAVGVAVDVPGGVMVPVLPVDQGIYEFAASLEGAIERARAGQLAAQDRGEAVIGISNVGMMGVWSLTPIIYPDQTFMLGVGAPRRVFRPDADGNPVVVQEISLSLSCDHRAVDGALGAKFLQAIVEMLENPLQLLLER